MKTLKTEFFRTWSVTKWVISIYFSNYPILVSITIVTHMMSALSGLVNAYIVALATDHAIQVLSEKSTNIYSFLPIVGMIIGSYLFFQSIDIVNTYVWRIISFKDYYTLRKLLIKRLSELGIQNLENPEITNKTQRFNEEQGNILNYLQSLMDIVAGIFTFTISGVVVLKSMPIVAAAFFVVMIFKFIGNQKFIRLLWVLNRDMTEERRKSMGAINYLAEPAPLKELILSQGTEYLEEKFNKYIDYVVGQVISIRKRWNVSKFINTILDSSVFGWGIVVILQRLVEGIISIGQLTFEIRTLRIFSDSFGGFMGNLVSLRESAIKISDIQELFSKYESENDGVLELSNITPNIKFENVSFKYINSDNYIFKNLNLEIKPGEKVAIVGENGAGKTTLVKLICRFYRVNSGNILLSNIDINDLHIKSWYTKLGILFQDYNAYGVLTVKENIEVDSTRNGATTESIIESLKKAGAMAFVQKYKNGLDQVLSERFKGGIRPSTGQWQKIAIARVFHRNSPVLILDEPTASIDAVAEAKIFDNIYKFAKNKTVIIISHRFSTVRNADRIIVLDKGKIIEEGSHEELLKNDGKYAKAFRLQAKGYQ